MRRRHSFRTQKSSSTAFTWCHIAQKPCKEDRAAVDVMLRLSDWLLQAYALKEVFYDFMAAPKRNEAERRLDFWLEACKRLAFGFRNFSAFRARILLVSCAHPYI